MSTEGKNSGPLRRFYAALGEVIRESNFGEFIKRAYSGLNKAVYVASHGRVWNRINNGQIILVTSIGCRSGEKRTQPLTTIPLDDGCYVVIGSNAGGPKDPAWVSNLNAGANAWITVVDRRLAVRARPVTDQAEWDSLFQRFVDVHIDYATYVTKTTRRLPIFVLEPVPEMENQ